MIEDLVRELRIKAEFYKEEYKKVIEICGPLLHKHHDQTLGSVYELKPWVSETISLGHCPNCVPTLTHPFNPLLPYNTPRIPKEPNYVGVYIKNASPEPKPLEWKQCGDEMPHEEDPGDFFVYPRVGNKLYFNAGSLHDLWKDRLITHYIKLS